MKFKPTKLFYAGCVIITLFGFYMGTFVNYYFAVIMAIIALFGFMDIELMNILARKYAEEQQSEVDK